MDAARISSPATTRAPGPIAVILPRREGFNAHSFGAISLTVRDFVLHSRYREDCHILGAATEEGFPGISYLPQKEEKRWWQSNTRAYVQACLAELEHLQPCLVEIHNRPVILRMLAQKFSSPLALHLHNDPQEMKAAQTVAERKALLQRCTAIYCVSEYIRGRFLEGLPAGKGREKVHVVYNGIEIPTSLPKKQKHILFVGRLTPEKGVLEFAEALAKILPSHPEWRGVIIGGRHHRTSDKLSSHEMKIASIARSMGAQMEFAGFRSHQETMQAFAKAEIAVVPSLWHEAFGRTALEAVACGCALVTSGRGGLKEITGDEASIIVPEVTQETLAKAITMLIEDDGLRQQFQSAGRGRSKRFSIERCTEMLDSIRNRIFSTLPTV